MCDDETLFLEDVGPPKEKGISSAINKDDITTVSPSEEDSVFVL
jgi:hypothetical protein